MQQVETVRVPTNKPYTLAQHLKVEGLGTYTFGKVESIVHLENKLIVLELWVYSIMKNIEQLCPSINHTQHVKNKAKLAPLEETKVVEQGIPNKISWDLSGSGEDEVVQEVDYSSKKETKALRWSNALKRLYNSANNWRRQC